MGCRSQTVLVEHAGKRKSHAIYVDTKLNASRTTTRLDSTDDDDRDELVSLVS